MFRFLKDLIMYPFDRSKDNRFGQFLTFCLKDYPVYFWVQPSWKKFLLFFVLAVRIIFYGYQKE